MATFDFATGTLAIDASTSLFCGKPSPDESPLTGATELARYGEWENYGVKNVKVWGKIFGVTARYYAKKLAMIDFVWADGVAKKIDWSTTEDDLVKEKKALSKIIASEAQSPCVSSTIGADTFVFNWGMLTVRVDLRSMIVMTSVAYTEEKS
ncbi:hypothetical protein LMG24238_06208 [Paraburkholderia sediminicola]|uniref:Uncharacterized protein n=1 Tax=Paraburkholderia sediminicola TaxID=458836 RepID=A0A6J5CHV2_9BURK|nr:hypothetical protein [Paraburkholderia sediminicola]CAB3736219.1 hypothetical protein LMG24238_06208 [Paraburkholderia sediminicola]